MPKEPPHNFHVRLPKDLLAVLMSEKGEKSLNKEIVARLRLTMTRDAATQIGGLLRPFLDSLDETDRERLLDLATEAASILAKAKKPKR